MRFAKVEMPTTEKTISPIPIRATLITGEIGSSVAREDVRFREVGFRMVLVSFRFRLDYLAAADRCAGRGLQE